MADTATLIAVFVAAGLVMGITGFGAGLVAMGILVTLMPVARATVIVAVLGLACPVLNLWTLRRNIQWREVWPILVTALPAALLGVFLLQNLPGQVLRIAVATMILAGCATMLWSPKKTRLHKSFPWAYGAGALGGVFNGALGTGGPPVVLYSLLRGWDKSVSKGVLSAYFTMTGTWRLIVLTTTGVATAGDLQLGALMLIPALAATYLGTHIFRRMSNNAFRYATMMLLVGLSVKLILS